VVISTATVLTTQLNEASSGLSNEREDSNKRVAMYVDEINSMAQEISIINKDIAAIESNGTVANELRDRRDLLLNEMAELVDITTYEMKMVLYLFISETMHSLMALCSISYI